MSDIQTFAEYLQRLSRLCHYTCSPHPSAARTSNFICWGLWKQDSPWNFILTLRAHPKRKGTPNSVRRFWYFSEHAKSKQENPFLQPAFCQRVVLKKLFRWHHAAKRSTCRPLLHHWNWCNRILFHSNRTGVALTELPTQLCLDVLLVLACAI